MIQERRWSMLVEMTTSCILGWHVYSGKRWDYFLYYITTVCGMKKVPNKARISQEAE